MRRLGFLLCIFGASFAHGKDKKLSILVSPTSYRACAADSQIATVYVALDVSISNRGKHPIILSRKIKNPIALHPLTANGKPFGNVDEFALISPRTVPLSDTPPTETFLWLAPGETTRTMTEGWLLVSRSSVQIPGSLAQGRIRASGVLDLWPYESSNVKQLERMWLRYGRLEFGSVHFQPVQLNIELKEPLLPCSVK
jgi:hypothetical protein